MRDSISRLSLLALMALVGLVPRAEASEKKPLPDFQLTSSQGHVFSSLQLGGKGRWLLVAVAPEDPMSERLLAAFKAWPESGWIARTTFLIEAPAKEAQAFVQKSLPEAWQRVSWASDEPKSAAAAFKWTGLPILTGMDHQRVEWTIGGVLNEPKTLQSIVESWLR